MSVGAGEPGVVFLQAAPQRAPSIWTRKYVRFLRAGDVACAFAACMVVLGTKLLFGAYIPVEDVVAGVALMASWPVTMQLSAAYRERGHGEGSEEFRAVFNGGVGLMATVAIGAYATQTSIARSLVMAALPLALVLTLAFRFRVRKKLHLARAHGKYMRHVIAVGHRAAVLDLIMQFRREPHHGMRVVGVCLPRTQGDLDVDGLPVLGGLQDVAAAVSLTQADAVAVAACPELDGDTLRRLAWSLEEQRTDLFVAPALMDVAGPRISIRPVAGMPLLHVDHPEFDGAKQIVKNVFDRVLAGIAIVVLLPAFALIALLIRLTSPGPAFFRQVRVGKGGEEFTVWKFRTMIVDAERLKRALEHANDGDGVLFKIRNDPRITRIGGFLRRYSLDEIPQLFNVISGRMSLVGPRPPLPEEVAKYGADVRRRLVVKPGMTGLWQVSGRSDLSWEESVRLDLRYVERWSLILDLQILWKTWSAVTRGEGAY
ncbi:sugar transferase [Nonomuraea sp. NPDC003804]|uniref:sugar transferase n=1 Tax=Nonomuraea sp. NPDC003804 TaxID=3154547 RepID=UPI0033BB8B62